MASKDSEPTTSHEATRTNESSSSLDREANQEKSGNGVEPIRTISRVPGNPNYYEKDGLRTYGDGQDHDEHLPMTFKRAMCLVAMSFLWCGSQIPLYLFGGCIAIIYGDILGADIYPWAIVGNLLALAAVTPFVGALSDLLGRRYVAMLGSVLIIVGVIISSTAKIMQVFIMGMIFAGAGAGICELTALAGAGELVPTKQRGIYIGLIVCTILPFCPAVLWAQLIAKTSWRYNGLFCGIWSTIGLLLVVFFYFPPPRANSSGLSRREILQRIDYIGGFLSISGLTLFLAGLQWGGNQYPWTSPHVVVPIVLGGLLCIAFAIYEAFFVKYPMFPARLKHDTRNLVLILLITAISGANFFAILIFWPTQSYSMYNTNAIQVGVRSLPIGFGIILGAILCSMAITILKGRIRLLLLISCVIMTAGTGAMSIAQTDNINSVYAPLCFAALGVGGVIIPNQIIVTIICPDDLIATATALALTVRVIGGSIGYAVYYNVFKTAFTNNAENYLATQLILNAGVLDINEITTIALDISSNLYGDILQFPDITTQAQYDTIVAAGRETFAMSFPIVWYSAIAFGGASIICCFFLRDIGKYMDSHIAVSIK